MGELFCNNLFAAHLLRFATLVSRGNKLKRNLDFYFLRNKLETMTH